MVMIRMSGGAVILMALFWMGVGALLGYALGVLSKEPE
jgi:hypothetical protein